METTMTRVCLSALFVVSAVVTAPAQRPAERKAWTPDSIVWTEINPDGTKYALLEGNRDTGGFTYGFFIPAGVWDAPHWHTADARVVVVKGQLKLGYGDAMDKRNAAAYDVGSYLLVPANARHFDGAEVDTIIIGTAVGPWRTEYVKNDE